MSSNLHFETLAVHAGAAVDPATGAVTPPIHLSTTFERAPDTSFPSGFSYTRSNNPTRQLLAAFEPGDHVVAPEDAYYGTPELLLDHFAPWGLQSTLVDMTDLDAVRRA